VLRLSEEAKPTIGDDEVLVRVHAASVDRGTWHIMTGRPYLMRAMGFGLRMPKARNPGRSFAGAIESCGQEVRAFEAGCRLRHLRWFAKAFGATVTGVCSTGKIDLVRLLRWPGAI
jgi:D-arabinose 1-dehydrogenase-like Zn-dependent alcohol dehydrogenase